MEKTNPNNLKRPKKQIKKSSLEGFGIEIDIIDVHFSKVPCSITVNEKYERLHSLKCD